jgi:hypothetical protein
LVWSTREAQEAFCVDREEFLFMSPEDIAAVKNINKTIKIFFRLPAHEWHMPV